MKALREPGRPERDESDSHRLRRGYRLMLPRILWRCAFMLLVTGGFFLKYGLIGSAGMRCIWRCADTFERWAENLEYRVR